MSSVSGEQFARPEAIGLMRNIRRAAGSGRPSGITRWLTAISGADPLNLAGILAPGPRIAAIAAHRIVLSDGLPTAALKAGQIVPLGPEMQESDQIERTLRVGGMSPDLRPYYG